MADYDSSLPIRTEAAGDVDVFISDATTPSQKLKVNADGSIDTNLATGAKVIVTDGTDDVEVNADGSLNAVVTATDLDIRDLEFATDSVTAHQGGSWTVEATATDLDIRDLSAAQDSVAAHLFDEAGVAFSASNPLPVIMSSDNEGDEICSFNTTSSVAANASTNHDYTVTTGKTLLIEQAWVSGSGKCKAELLVNGVLKFVGFNSTANANIEIPVKRLLKGLTTEVVRITVTNLDKQAQDLYSTLSGLEL
jgi:hypothetical protein